MTTTFNANSLELTVANFGPIAEASIELRPMSVFVGPSNTGKSYMAALIYVLHKFFNAYSGDDIRSPMLLRKRQSPDLSTNDLSGLYAWTKETISDLQTTKHEKSYLIELPESIAMSVRPIINNIAHLSGDLEGEITRCFGVEKAKTLIRHLSDGKTILSLYRNNSKEVGQSDLFGYEVEVTEQGAKIDAAIPNTMPLQMNMGDISVLLWNWHVDWLAELENMGFNKMGSKATANLNIDWLTELENMESDGKERAKRILEDLLCTLASDIASDIAGPLSRPAHYLPADRAGVMHAHQVVVRSLIARASRTALRPDSPMPVLSGVLGDFMEQLVALAGSSRRAHRKNYDNLAQRLEQTLLRGAVRVEQSPINYPSFVFQPNGWKRDLPLMNASSMVSELAPVVLYLRHVVQPGDLLIIEEPEAHLHPAMQVEFIRQLAAAVQSGVRILITTHSEWVLEELANLVRLSELPEERRGGIDDEDIVLSPDQVGAWFFEPSSEGNGSVVREISLDTESATFPAGFGLVTESLYNRWAEISARIQEG